MESINFIEAKDNEIYESVKKSVLERFMGFKEEDMLIANRFSNASYLNIMKDALYSYKAGSVLLDRFFIKSKCGRADMLHNEFSDDDKNIIEEFHEFAKNIPDATEISDEESKLYTDKINEYQKKIQLMEPESRTLQVYYYDEVPLLELSNTDDRMIEELATLSTNFFFNFTNAVFWETLDSKIVSIIGIPYDGYVDVVATFVSEKPDNEIEKDEN